MPPDNPHASRLHHRLDWLGFGLSCARSLAVLGTFACVLGVAAVILGLIDLWLPMVPAAWGGGVSLLLAAGASWLVAHRLNTQPEASPQLAICLRIERDTPAVGERLSRAMRLVEVGGGESLAAPEACALHQRLRQAAVDDAAQALNTVPLRRWFCLQPEVHAAVATVAVAIAGWAGIAWSLSSGLSRWQESFARQFQATPQAPLVDGSSPRASPGISSVADATLQVFRHTIAARDRWQRPTAGVSLQEEAAALAREAMWANQLATTFSVRSDALILKRLAAGLDESARVAASGDESARPDVIRVLNQLVASGEAAASLADAQEALRTGSQLFFSVAASSAGRPAVELDTSEREWRDTLARHLTLVTAGIVADQSLLIRDAVLTTSERASIDTTGLTAAAGDNRLFLVSQQLADAADALSMITTRLGMPPQTDSTARSFAAVAREAITRLAPAELARTPQPPRGEQTVAVESAGSQTEGQPLATTAETAKSEGPAAVDDATAPATGAAAGLASDGSSATTSPSRIESSSSGSVWVPDASELRKPQQQAPFGGRAPPATPGYFRRLLNRAAEVQGCEPHQSQVTQAAGLLSLAVLMAVAAEEDAEVDGERAPPNAGMASAAVERGLVWLVSAQQPDGSFGSGRFRGSVAVTAHGLLALASTGSTSLAGPHAEASRRAVRFLTERAANDGLIAGNEDSAHGPMYGHAFAIQALAELSGESDRPELMAVVRRGCRLIEQTQNREGGWRYQPRPADADISVTAAMVVALEAAAAAGVAVSEQTIEQAVGYLLRLQNPDGGFRYVSAEGPSGAARTAAALVALNLTSPLSEDALSAGRRWLRQHPIAPDPTDGYAAYGMLASSTAAWQHGGGAWAQWYADTAADLLAAQAADGSWPDPSCPEYGTAAAILSLTTANGLLPGWKRGRQP